MINTPPQLNAWREPLAQLLVTEQVSLVEAWLASGVFAGEHHEDAVTLRSQAARFLHGLAEGVQRSAAQDGPLTPGIEAGLQRAFPLVFYVHTLLPLPELLEQALQAQSPAQPIPPRVVWSLLQAGVAAYPLEPVHVPLFSERIARLNQLSWQLNMLRNEDAIWQATLAQAPALAGAASCAIWLWDADQQAPVMKLSSAGESELDFACPPSLLALMRRTCESCCAFSIDAGESEPDWPEEFYQREVAFIPLPAEHGCLGLLTVHHQPEGHFAHDDILLLSSLSDLVATALRNVQLYGSERQLVGLLQSSIRQVVQATTQQGRQEEFITSLLQVAEGLTRADAVSAFLVQEDGPIVQASSGTLAARHPEALASLAQYLHIELAGRPSLALQGQVSAIAETLALPDDCRHQHYAIAVISLDGKRIGLLYALTSLPVSEEQIAFLQTIAEQMSMGIKAMQQTTSNQRLVVELANVNYFTKEITSTFDPVHILSLTSQAASQALNTPIVLCGWWEEDGSLRITPGTSIGLTPAIERALRLTDRNRIFRRVLEQRTELSSQDLVLRQDRGGGIPGLEEAHIKDWVCVPMVVEGRARGIVLAADQRTREFSSRQVALLSTYAHQAGLALANSLLYDQVNQQLQQMELLFSVTGSISSTLDLNAIFSNLMQAASEALQTTAAMVCLAEGSDGVQTVRDTLGFIADTLADTRWQSGEGLIGTVYQRKLPLAVSALRSEGRDAALRALAQQEGFASALVVPLRGHVNTLGTLAVFSTEVRTFTPAQQHLIEAMATSAAAAVQNARLYQQERERARELRLVVAEVESRLSSTFAIVGDLLAIVQETEPGPTGLERMRRRLLALVAVQETIAEEQPTQADAREAANRLLVEMLHQRPTDGPLPQIAVRGARVLLPSRTAAWLALYVHEWAMAALEHAGAAPLCLDVTFQQFGRQVMLQLDDSVDWQEKPISLNSAIMAKVAEELHGEASETIEEGQHRIRLRFARPDVE